LSSASVVSPPVAVTAPVALAAPVAVTAPVVVAPVTFVVPTKVAKHMKGRALDRIADLAQWSSGAAEDEHEAERSRTIAHGVTSAQFIKALEDAKFLPCKFTLINGDVIIYELPSRPHSQAIARIIGLVEVFNLGVANNSLIAGTSTRLTLGPNTVLEPDIDLRPVGLTVPPALADATGLTFPDVVWEVAWSQAYRQLHNFAPIYLGPNTSIQLYGALKIYPRRINQTFALLVVLYSRANVPLTTPVHAISFGTAPVSRGHLPAVIRPLLTGVGFGGPACNQVGLPAYQLPLPVASIYHGVAMPAGLPVNFNIDLYQIQRQIFA